MALTRGRPGRSGRVRSRPVRSGPGRSRPVRRALAATAAVALVTVGSAHAAGFGAAVVDRVAGRGISVDPAATCDLETIEALAADHPDVEQFVLMATESWASTSGTVEVSVRDDAGRWWCQTAPVAARFGRSGTRPLEDRRSGDGTTPAGVFPLGEVTAWDGQIFSMFGNRPDPGVRVAYRSVRSQDCWGATPNTPDYQHLVARPGCPGPDDEWLPRFGDVYSHAAVIGANLDPISGDDPGELPFAAAIFLHRHAYATSGATRPTSGCVSIAYGDLVEVLRLLDPARSPHFAIGPRDWLAAP